MSSEEDKKQLALAQQRLEARKQQLRASQERKPEKTLQGTGLEATLERMRKRVEADEAARRGSRGPQVQETVGPRSEAKTPTAAKKPIAPKTKQGRAPSRVAIDPDHARYDHTFAEFPAFRLGKHTQNGPIHYEDTITGPDGAPMNRRWTVRHDAEFGVGTAFTNALLFSLDQVWKEQGFRGHRIFFGTFSKLHQMRCPGQYPSGADIKRLRRHLDILCGYRLDCENSFFDPSTKTYGTMRGWSLFTGWYEPGRMRGANATQEELPFSWIEVSDTFLRIARERGFFVTGFDTPFFFSLSDTEQRLALYLSKMFGSQTLHQRKMDTLAAALPTSAKEPKKQRQTVRRAAQGLLDKGWPYLRGFEISKGSAGDWVARFQATRKIPQDYPLPRPSLEDLQDSERALVEDLVELLDDAGSERFWANSIRRLGEQPMRHQFSEMKSDMREGRLPSGSNVRKLMTTRVLRLARERGITITHRKPKAPPRTTA